MQRKTIKAWALWTLLFIPLFTASMFALHRFGLARVVPALLALLLITRLYQRYVKKRGWTSILWGRET